MSPPSRASMALTGRKLILLTKVSEVSVLVGQMRITHAYRQTTLILVELAMRIVAELRSLNAY